MIQFPWRMQDIDNLQSQLKQIQASVSDIQGSLRDAQTQLSTAERAEVHLSEVPDRLLVWPALPPSSSLQNENR